MWTPMFQRNIQGTREEGKVRREKENKGHSHSPLPIGCHFLSWPLKGENIHLKIK
jgi:hypothetical protein